MWYAPINTAKCLCINTCLWRTINAKLLKTYTLMTQEQICLLPQYRGVKYCDQHVWMSVCLSAWSHISKTMRLMFRNFLYIHVVCVLSSVLLWRQYNMYFTSYVGDVMFSYSTANGPESKMTCIFPPFLQVAAPGRRLPSQTAFCLGCHLSPNRLHHPPIHPTKPHQGGT